MDSNSSLIDTRMKKSLAKLLVRRAVLAALFFLLGVGYCASSYGQILGTANLEIERRGHTATVIENGKILIVPRALHSAHLPDHQRLAGGGRWL
jgi:hypothetical protein